MQGFVFAEGEEKPEPEPEFVPPEACAVLIQAASPGEFIDKLGIPKMLFCLEMIQNWRLRLDKDILIWLSRLSFFRSLTSNPRSYGMR